VEYKFDKGACVPLRIHTIVISTQHSPQVTQEQLRDDLLNKIIKKVVPKELLGKIIKENQ
jgi:S-adenosylmethionine synthetase